MANSILIVADDLSGAADCAAACGLDAAVVLDGCGDFDADVLAVDANTRGLGADAAAAETTRIVKAFGRPGQILFKKIDSRLRGNIGAEVAAALRAHGGSLVMMAPAFPAMGRTTTGGIQHVHGTPLGDVRLLLENAGLRTMLAEKGRIPEHVAGYDAVVCDAETDDDLRAVAEAATSLDREIVWAGSAGLARYLPGKSRGRALTAPVRGPIAIVVGSPSSVSREQARVLTREMNPNSGQDTLSLIHDASEARALNLSSFGGFIFTGGETARAALESLDVPALRVIKEVEPGVPLSMTVEAEPRPVITKSGAFGDPGTLVRCRAALRDL